MCFLKSLKQQVFCAIVILISIGINTHGMAQFAPPAGVEGTTAIKADSAVFVDWVSSADFQPGWMNIADTTLGFVDFGGVGEATGLADNSVVSLGDGGQVTCYFTVPLADGPGWDFAVFENSFDDTFLELAFVEVSSNGFDFVRFPATSLTPFDEQIPTFGVLDATKINNLAGKYRGGFGVPFDLAVFGASSSIDVNHIVAVRVVDVVGCVASPFASTDDEGNVINDPWPTPFETGGFDLDAIGVIHNQDNTAVDELMACPVRLFPVPAKEYVTLAADLPLESLVVVSLCGQTMWQKTNSHGEVIDCENWPSGMYYLNCRSQGEVYQLKMVKY